MRPGCTVPDNRPLLRGHTYIARIARMRICRRTNAGYNQNDFILKDGP